MRRLRVGLSRFSTWHATLLASLLLLGCRGRPYQPMLDDDTYTLPRLVVGTSDRTVIRLQRSFNRCGIKVITVGQDYLISIPSSALFPAQSPRIKWESYGVLNKVVLFMKQFRKVAVNVTSYSSKYVSGKREQALTLARARNVAQYLWSQGIDSRFIFTEGAGSDKPITAYAPGTDNSPNSRIEITFRDAIV